MVPAVGRRMASPSHVHCGGSIGQDTQATPNLAIDVDVAVGRVLCLWCASLEKRLDCETAAAARWCALDFRLGRRADWWVVWAAV